jgi:hypothetical protein
MPTATMPLPATSLALTCLPVVSFFLIRPQLLTR